MPGIELEMLAYLTNCQRDRVVRATRIVGEGIRQMQEVQVNCPALQQGLDSMRSDNRCHPGVSPLVWLSYVLNEVQDPSKGLLLCLVPKQHSA